ncbi:MAG TPA: UbiA-like polyprenyltransferase [Chitinophagaceae bacterium]|nr:UbiA-like polyprenyltransferase [Chitinophagaceae bacterium]
MLKNYLSLIKFSHTIFAMPFSLIGFFLALNKSGNFDFSDKEIYIKLLLVILCMVFARSAAMAFNRYLDRKFDAKNPRTAIREIPSGKITSQQALIFTVITSLLFIIVCYFINDICFYLSPVALAVVLGYSYTKRFTWLCHIVLGLGLSLAPMGAYLAVTGSFHWLPMLFSFAVIFWVSGFDIIYALQDEAFDKEHNLYSIPAFLGKKKGLRISALLHLFSVVAVLIAGYSGNFGWCYWIGSAIFTGILIYQHSLVKPNDLSRVNLAFMTSNGIASVVFAIFVIADLLIKNI